VIAEWESQLDSLIMEILQKPNQPHVSKLEGIERWNVSTLDERLYTKFPFYNANIYQEVCKRVLSETSQRILPTKKYEWNTWIYNWLHRILRYLINIKFPGTSWLFWTSLSSVSPSTLRSHKVLSVWLVQKTTRQHCQYWTTRLSLVVFFMPRNSIHKSRGGVY
jgi:hypothetical protein